MDTYHRPIGNFYDIQTSEVLIDDGEVLMTTNVGIPNNVLFTVFPEERCISVHNGGGEAAVNIPLLLVRLEINTIPPYFETDFQAKRCNVNVSIHVDTIRLDNSPQSVIVIIRAKRNLNILVSCIYKDIHIYFAAYEADRILICTYGHSNGEKVHKGILLVHSHIYSIFSLNGVLKLIKANDKAIIYDKAHIRLRGFHLYHSQKSNKRMVKK